MFTPETLHQNILMEINGQQVANEAETDPFNFLLVP